MIIKNTDEMSDTKVFAVTNGDIAGRCAVRAVDVSRKYDLGIEFGQVMAFSRKLKIWIGLYSYHFWNYDENGNIYDSHSLLDYGYAHFTDGGKLNGRKCVELDGDEFRWLKQEPDYETYQYQGIYKHLNKYYRDNKVADLIYVRNHGYLMAPESMRIGWDEAEKRIEVAEYELDHLTNPQPVSAMSR